jgi:hypothetical protein
MKANANMPVTGSVDMSNDNENKEVELPEEFKEILAPLKQELNSFNESIED